MLELLSLFISHYEHTSDEFDNFSNKSIIKGLYMIFDIIVAIGDEEIE